MKKEGKMTVKELIEQAFLLATGKNSNLEAGAVKYEKLKEIGNIVQNMQDKSNYAPLGNSGDLVEFENIGWLSHMMAAEYVRNDRTRQHQYTNLVALANSYLDNTNPTDTSVNVIPRVWDMDTGLVMEDE